jgi:hypothetical protein
VAWCWFVDRLEQAGLDVRLVNPLEANKRMANGYKRVAKAQKIALGRVTIY